MDKYNIEHVGSLKKTQLGILFQEKHKSNTYVESFMLKINTSVSFAQIEKACENIERSQATLRSIIVSENVTKPLVVYLKSNPVPLKNVDLVAESEVALALEQEKQNGIDISKNAIRGIVCRIKDNIEYIIFISHHIFIDGWSSSIIFSDFSKALNGDQLPVERPYYAYMERGNAGRIDLHTYEDYVGIMYIPESIDGVSSVNEYDIDIGSDLTQKISNYCRTLSITKAVFFSAAYSLYLAAYNNMHADFGFVVSGRNDLSYQNTVGLFIKTIPFTVDVSKRTVKEVFDIILCIIDNAETGILPIMPEFTERGFEECNSLLVIENYPFIADGNAPCSLFAVSENTHYDLVMQVLGNESISLKLLTGEDTRNLRSVAVCFIDLLKRIIDFPIDTKSSKIVQSRTANLNIAVPFESYYLIDKLKHSFACFDFNLRVFTYGNQELGLLGNESLDSDLVIIYAPYLLSASGTTSESFSLYYQNIKQILTQKEYRRLLFIDISSFKTIQKRSNIEEEVTGATKTLVSLLDTRSNTKYVDLSKYNNKDIWNHLMYINANIPFEESFYTILQQKIDAFYLADRFKPKKILITDGDETLWNGTIRNDGIESISLDDGKIRFQQQLKKARGSGFLLALCTRNDMYDVKALFESCNDFELSLEDFAMVLANDAAKSDNIRKICNDLTLGLESVVFFDDSLYECAEVMTSIPEALVIPAISKNTKLVFDDLFCLKADFAISEDNQRNQVYSNEQNRNTVANSYVDIREFWKSLRTRIEFSYPNIKDVPRIIQLSSRTNRFRNNAENIDTRAIDANIMSKRSFVLRAKDRFGEYGLISYISWKPSVERENTVIIDHWYMSCRLSVEYAEFIIYNYMLDFFKQNGFKYVCVDLENIGTNKRFVGFVDKIAESVSVKDIGFSVEQKYKAYDDILVECVLVEKDADEEDQNTVSLIEQVRQTKSQIVLMKNQENDYVFPKELYNSELTSESLRYWNYLIGDNIADKWNTGIATLDSWSNKELVKLKNLWERYLDNTVTDYNKSFVSYGGKSIKYMELISMIVEEWKLNISDIPFSIENTITDHYRFIFLTVPTKPVEIVHSDKTSFDISSFSEKMLIESQRKDDRALHMPFLLWLDSAVTKQDFIDALTSSISKYRIFKCNITVYDSNVVYNLTDNYELDVEEIVTETKPDAMFVSGLIEKFDLSSAPLMHVKLIHCETGDEYVFLDFCHLVIDGPSIIILVKDLIGEMLGVNSKVTSQLDYLDYTEWYHSEANSSGIEYWKKELSGMNSSLDVPYIKNGMGDTDEVVSRKLGTEFSCALAAMANKNDVTCFTQMLMLYSAFLHRLTANNDINIGVPISCRNHPDMINEPGMFVNTVIFRSEYSGNSIRNYNNSAKNKVENMIKYKNAMLQDVIADFDSKDGSVPFDTMFIYQDYSAEINSNIFFSEVPVFLNNAQSMLDVRVIHTSSDIELVVSYDCKRLTHINVCSLIDSFIEFARSILFEKFDLDSKLSDTILMSAENEQKIATFEGQSEDLGEECLTDRFIKTAHKYPKNLAVSFESTEITYACLNNITNYVAENLGCRNKTILVICDNPILVVVSMISVMKSGNIYLPVSAKTPKERLLQIIDECNADMYMASRRSDDLTIDYYDLNIKELLIDENLDTMADVIGRYSPDDVAYIIYTSGTTGKSKGVAVPHRGVTNGVINRITSLSLDSDFSSIQLMGYAFDGFIQSLFSPLLSGATLYMVDDICNYEYIESTIKKHTVKTFLTTPTMYESLLSLSEAGLLSDVEMVALAGETLGMELVLCSKEMYPDIRIVNEYGPTENSIVSTINSDVCLNEAVTIGRPILNCKVRIVDEFAHRCPVGMIGELYLSGIGLAKQYINDETLTNERFVILDDGYRWYRTGDYASWSPNGEIIFCGRKDSLVKVNGFRVDLSEIEHVLMKSQLFEKCYITLSSNNEIVAYYVANNFVSLEKIVSEVSKKLEYYMIPSEFYRVSSIPIKESGKVNLPLLKELIVVNNMNCKYATDFANKISVYFGRVLNKENYTISDSFFSVGGNSIKAMILIEQLNKMLSMEIDVETFRVFNSPLKLAKKLLVGQGGSVKTSEIQPFNKFWFINCFYTSVMGVLEYYDVSFAPFIKNFIVNSVTDDNGFNIVFEPIVSQERLFESLGVDYLCCSLTDSFAEDISEFLFKKIPIIAHVDCYYLPYCKDKYQIEHHNHVVTITGYNNVGNMYRIIDQQDLRSISFEYKTISSKALFAAIQSASAERETFHDCDYVVFSGTHAECCNEKTYEYRWNNVVRHTIDYLDTHCDYDELNISNVVLNFLKMERSIALRDSDNDAAIILRKLMGKIQRRIMWIVTDDKKASEGITLLQILKTTIGVEC